MRSIVNLRILNFTLSQFINAILNEWPMSDITNKQCTGESNPVGSFLSRPALLLTVSAPLITVVPWDFIHGLVTNCNGQKF